MHSAFNAQNDKIIGKTKLRKERYNLKLYVFLSFNDRLNPLIINLLKQVLYKVNYTYFFHCGKRGIILSQTYIVNNQRLTTILRLFNVARFVHLNSFMRYFSVQIYKDFHIPKILKTDINI